MTNFDEHELRRDLRTRARHLQDAEIRVQQLRYELDRALFYRHDTEGVPVGALALAAGMSRETAYKAIKRVRVDCSPDEALRLRAAPTVSADRRRLGGPGALAPVDNCHDHQRGDHDPIAR